MTWKQLNPIPNLIIETTLEHCHGDPRFHSNICPHQRQLNFLLYSSTNISLGGVFGVYPSTPYHKRRDDLFLQLPKICSSTGLGAYCES